MIKQFIDMVENVALRAMFKYIDTQLDKHEKDIESMKIKYTKEIDELRDEVKLLRDNQIVFKDTEKVVQAYINLSKVAKKAGVTAVVTGIIGFILYQLGITGR